MEAVLQTKTTQKFKKVKEKSKSRTSNGLMTTVLDPLVSPDWAPKIQVVLFRARAVTQFLLPSHSETIFVVLSRSTAFETGLLGSSFSSDPKNR